MGKGRHIGYVIRKKDGIVYYRIFVKSKMTPAINNQLIKIKGEGRILIAKEQLENETKAQFDDRIAIVTRNIARQRGLRYQESKTK